MLRGVLRTTEIFRWRSSSSLRGCAPLPHTIFLWQLGPTAAFPFLIKLFQLQVISRVFINITFTVVIHKGALNSLWAPFGSHTSAPNIPPHPSPGDGRRPPHLPPLVQGHAAGTRRISTEMSLPPAQAAIKMFGTAFPAVSV